MDQSFDEEYARYLNFLSELDKTDDIAEKNLLFRQLTEQLSDLENRLNNQSCSMDREEASNDDPDLIYWI